MHKYNHNNFELHEHRLIFGEVPNNEPPKIETADAPPPSVEAITPLEQPDADPSVGAETIEQGLVEQAENDAGAAQANLDSVNAKVTSSAEAANIQVPNIETSDRRTEALNWAHGLIYGGIGHPNLTHEENQILEQNADRVYATVKRLPLNNDFQNRVNLLVQNQIAHSSALQRIKYKISTPVQQRRTTTLNNVPDTPQPKPPQEDGVAEAASDADALLEGALTGGIAGAGSAGETRDTQPVKPAEKPAPPKTPESDDTPPEENPKSPEENETKTEKKDVKELNEDIKELKIPETRSEELGQSLDNGISHFKEALEEGDFAAALAAIFEIIGTLSEYMDAISNNSLNDPPKNLDKFKKSNDEKLKKEIDEHEDGAEGIKKECDAEIINSEESTKDIQQENDELQIQLDAQKKAQKEVKDDPEAAKKIQEEITRIETRMKQNTNMITEHKKRITHFEEKKKDVDRLSSNTSEEKEKKDNEKPVEDAHTKVQNLEQNMKSYVADLFDESPSKIRNSISISESPEGKYTITIEPALMRGWSMPKRLQAIIEDPNMFAHMDRISGRISTDPMSPKELEAFASKMRQDLYPA